MSKSSLRCSEQNSNLQSQVQVQQEKHPKIWKTPSVLALLLGVGRQGKGLRWGEVSPPELAYSNRCYTPGRLGPANTTY